MVVVCAAVPCPHRAAAGSTRLIWVCRLRAQIKSRVLISLQLHSPHIPYLTQTTTYDVTWPPPRPTDLILSVTQLCMTPHPPRSVFVLSNINCWSDFTIFKAVAGLLPKFVDTCCFCVDLSFVCSVRNARRHHTKSVQLKKIKTTSRSSQTAILFKSPVCQKKGRLRPVTLSSTVSANQLAVYFFPTPRESHSNRFASDAGSRNGRFCSKVKRREKKMREWALWHRSWKLVVAVFGSVLRCPTWPLLAGVEQIPLVVPCDSLGSLLTFDLVQFSSDKCIVSWPTFRLGDLASSGGASRRLLKVFCTEERRYFLQRALVRISFVIVLCSDILHDLCNRVNYWSVMLSVWHTQQWRMNTF